MSTSTAHSTEDASNTLEVHVEGKPARLYTGHLRPGSRVILMAESPLSGSDVTVTFGAGETPFLGCGPSFQLGPGAPVEFLVAQGADGEYLFRLESGALSAEGCRLVVAPDGDLDKTGFVVRQSASALRVSQLSYQRSSGRAPLRLVVDAGNGEAQVAIRQPGGEPRALESSEVDIPVSGFGCVAVVSLVAAADPSSEGKGQTGGTEHVEIVVEPPT